MAARDPYAEVTRFLAMHRDKHELVLRTLSYFDAVNFARRAKADVRAYRRGLPTDFSAAIPRGRGPLPS